MTEAIEKNDCVFCENETLTGEFSSFCDYYRKDIHVPNTPGEKGAFRQQTLCQGFRFKPHMVDTWDRAFKKKLG